VNKAFLIIFLMLVSVIAYADTGYTTVDPSLGPFYASPQAACDARFSSLSASQQLGYRGVRTVVAPYNTCVTTNNDSSWTIYAVPDKYTPPPTCTISDKGPMNVTTAWATGGSAGAAIAKKVIPDGTFSGPFNISTSKQFCSGQCTMTASAGPTSCSIDSVASSNGYNRISCMVPMIGTGSICNSNQEDPVTGPSAVQPPAANTASNGSCPTGSVPAGQDSSGMTICQGKASTTPPPTTTTTAPASSTTDASGNTVKTQAVASTNADGSVTTTTTTTTTTPSGAVTVAVKSVTGNAPAGTAGTQDTPQQQKDMCALHPELNICQNSQVQGLCEQVTCTGDAIECATLRAASAIQCRDKDDHDTLAKSSLVTDGNALIAGSDPKQAQIDAALKGTTVDLSNPNLDQSGFLGGGSCFGTKTFHVMGRTVSYDFASVCANIQPLRYVMLSIGFILAYLIVSKSLLQS